MKRNPSLKICKLSLAVCYPYVKITFVRLLAFWLSIYHGIIQKDALTHR